MSPSITAFLKAPLVKDSSFSELELLFSIFIYSLVSLFLRTLTGWEVEVPVTSVSISLAFNTFSL